MQTENLLTAESLTAANYNGTDGFFFRGQNNNVIFVPTDCLLISDHEISGYHQTKYVLNKWASLNILFSDGHQAALGSHAFPREPLSPHSKLSGETLRRVETSGYFDQFCPAMN